MVIAPSVVGALATKIRRGSGVASSVGSAGLAGYKNVIPISFVNCLSRHALGT